MWFRYSITSCRINVSSIYEPLGLRKSIGKKTDDKKIDHNVIGRYNELLQGV